jgi:hypothetical protein
MALSQSTVPLTMALSQSTAEPQGKEFPYRVEDTKVLDSLEEDAAAVSERASAPVSEPPAMQLLPQGVPSLKVSHNTPVNQRHVCLENVKDLKNGKPKTIACYLCALLDKGTRKGDPLKSIYGCGACGQGYHVNCFAIVHNPDFAKASNDRSKRAVESLEKQVMAAPLKRPRRSSLVTRPSDLEF